LGALSIGIHGFTPEDALSRAVAIVEVLPFEILGDPEAHVYLYDQAPTHLHHHAMRTFHVQALAVGVAFWFDRYQQAKN
jgi:hypothetical protein